MKLSFSKHAKVGVIAENNIIANREEEGWSLAV